MKACQMAFAYAIKQIELEQRAGDESPCQLTERLQAHSYPESDIMIPCPYVLPVLVPCSFDDHPSGLRIFLLSF